MGLLEEVGSLVWTMALWPKQMSGASSERRVQLTVAVRGSAEQVDELCEQLGRLTVTIESKPVEPQPQRCRGTRKDGQRCQKKQMAELCHHHKTQGALWPK